MKKNETTEEQQKIIQEVNEGIDKVGGLLEVWGKLAIPTDQCKSLGSELVATYGLSFKQDYMLGSVADAALGKILSNPEIQNLPADEMIKIANRAIENPIEKMANVDYHLAYGARTCGYKKGVPGIEHPAAKNERLAQQILNAARLKKMSITGDEGKKASRRDSNSKTVTQGQPKNKRPSI